MSPQGTECIAAVRLDRAGAESPACLQDQAGGVEPSAEELDFVLHTAVRPLSVPLLCGSCL